MGMTLWGWVILLGLASCGQTSQETWATYQQAFSYIHAVAWRGGRRRRCLPRPHRLSWFSLHAPCPGQGFPLSASSMACVLSSRGACAEESGASGLLWPPRISPAGHVPSEWQAVLILFNCLAPVPFGVHTPPSCPAHMRGRDPGAGGLFRPVACGSPCVWKAPWRSSRDSSPRLPTCALRIEGEGRGGDRQRR